MGLKFKNIIGVLVVVIAATGFQSAAMAQSSLVARLRGSNETLSETVNRAFFRNDPEFFRNRSLKRQVEFIFGVGSLGRNSFLESEIVRDANLIDIVYQDALEQQASSDPIIRTSDLPNPYETSVLLSPRVTINSQAEDEVIFETQQPQ